MELTWSLDYCLACDRQTSGGAYCSQSCRLVDQETSTWSGPSSPTNTTQETQRGSGFYLSPAINFANYKITPAASTSTSTSSNPRPATAQPSYFSTNYTQQPSNKVLSPSSSRSSLSSNSSDQSQNQLSEQIHNELRAYTNCFDTTRNWRRRTWS